MEEDRTVRIGDEWVPELKKAIHNKDPQSVALFDALLEDILREDLSEVMQNSAKKYELLMKIGFLGNLVIDATKDSKFEVFRYSRNIAVDYFHMLPDRAVAAFIENFTNVFKKKSVDMEFFSTMNNEWNAKNKDQVLYKHFKEPVSGVEHVKNFFCQIGYFLIKCGELYEQGNYYGAGMAILGATNCAKAFNRALPKQKRSERGKGPGLRTSEYKSALTTALADARGTYAHKKSIGEIGVRLESDYKEIRTCLENIVEAATDAGVPDFSMKDIIEYSKSRVLREDVPNKPSSESPRIRW